MTANHKIYAIYALANRDSDSYNFDTIKTYFASKYSFYH